MKEIVIFMVLFVLAMAVGVIGDYFAINRFIKYALMIVAVIFGQKLMRKWCN